MTRRLLLMVVVLAVPLALVGCEELVAPQSTNPAIGQWLDNHVVEWNTTVPQSGKLLVFLPGQNLHPSQSKELLTEVANAGTPAIGLQDPNTFNVYDLCNADTTCEANIRTEVIYGTDTSPLVDISPANSIVGRLVSLLQYLDAEHPNAFGTFGWGAFLDGSQPKWSSIVVAGHSQGGSNAAFIAKDQQVARVVMLAATNDNDGQGHLAGWITGAHATPSNRYYGLLHTGDGGASVYEASWTALGLTGPLTSVDGATAPYGGSHELTTSFTTSDPHDSIALDSATPLDGSGTPVLAPVWRYLCCS